MLNRLKGFLYDTVRVLATMGPRKKTGAILIIKTDEIGDYILWRNFLKEIVASEKLTGNPFHFCGNQSWKSIYTTFDTGGVAKEWWLDKIRFKKDLRYRYRFLRNIYLQGYATVINPLYSRDKRNDDAIVMAARAKENIGMKPNSESVQDYEAGYDKGLYTRLYEHPEKPVFEFYRNRAFTEYLLQQKSLVTDTQIPAHLLPAIPVTLPNNYFIVFTGSRSEKRIWPTENFCTVARSIYNKQGWTAVVCGAPGDKPHTDAFCHMYDAQYIDLTAKTSLTQLLTVLKNAKLLLSVDTGSVHLAAAVGCPVVGIFNGSQYKRFAPYPKEIAAQFYAVYPDAVEKELSDPELVKSKYEFVVDVPYGDVTAEKVIELVQTKFLS